MAGTPSDAEIIGAVEALSAGDFQAREEAYDNLLSWGAGEPDRILALLPKEAADPEMRSACERLRRRLPTERYRRALLSAIEKAPKAAFSRSMTADQARTVVNQFFDEESPSLLASLSYMLQPPPPEAADAIFHFRISRDPVMRSTVISTLARIDPDRVRPIIDAFLADDAAGVRASAIQALAKLDGRKAIPRISEKLSDKNRDVRLRAIHLLADTGPETAPILRGYVKNQFSDMATMDRNLAAYAMLGLVKMKDRESAPLFVSLADQFDLLVRATAVWGLGHLDDTRYASVIAARLDDTEAIIRNSAACGLAVLSQDKTVQETCKNLLSLGIDGQLEFFLGKEEDLLLGGGAEGHKPDEKAIAMAKAWWEAHRNDPAYSTEK